MTGHRKASSIAEAWKIAGDLIETDYMKDQYISQRAGYPTYVSTLEGCDDHINDLGSRLEVCLVQRNAYINIWIDDTAEKVRKALAQRTAELYA